MRYGRNNRQAVVNVRKNRITIKEQLSNGQWLYIWFGRRRVNDKQQKVKPRYPDTKIVYLWSVAIYIGDSPKDARRWYDLDRNKRMGSSKMRITGKCGLEGLKKALDHIIYFCENLKERDEMHIYCDDKRRFSAYRYLMRLNGFLEGNGYYAFRHPHWWHWQ